MVLSGLVYSIPISSSAKPFLKVLVQARRLPPGRHYEAGGRFLGMGHCPIRNHVPPSLRGDQRVLPILNIAKLLSSSNGLSFLMQYANVCKEY